MNKWRVTPTKAAGVSSWDFRADAMQVDREVLKFYKIQADGTLGKLLSVISVANVVEVQNLGEVPED